MKGTNPTVITGDQGAPGGQVEGHDGEEGGGAGEASATLIDVNGKKIGTAEFTKAGSGVKIVVTVTQGLAQGFHGMHIHTNGVCDPKTAEPFSSAGGHLQVGGRTGHPSSGDLVSIYIGSNGGGTTTTTSEAVMIDQIIGKSLVIHGSADNFGNIPDRYSAEGKPGPDEKTLAKLAADRERRGSDGGARKAANARSGLASRTPKLVNRPGPRGRSATGQSEPSLQAEPSSELVIGRFRHDEP